MARERTHWEGCWRDHGHHDCAISRVLILLDALDEFKRVRATEALHHHAPDAWAAVERAIADFGKRTPY
jgi:hypothetical protein